jgi:ferredoxin-NADP reductase
MAAMARRDLVLHEAEMLSPSVRSLTFRTADRAPFTWTAGQWITLYHEVDGDVVDRSYSIATPSDPAAPDRFELAVTLVEGGPMSSALHAMSAGATTTMQGPFGFFTLDHAPPDVPIVFVGTGTGVTPLRAMIRDELRRGTRRRLTLLFGCRTPEDVLYRDELEALAAEHDLFDYHVTLSRPTEAWTERRGYVQAHLADFCADDRAHVYVCGLSGMVKEVRRTLKEELGYDRKRIHTERYD